MGKSFQIELDEAALFLLATVLNQSKTVVVLLQWFILVLNTKILLILSSRDLLI